MSLRIFNIYFCLAFALHLVGQNSLPNPIDLQGGVAEIFESKLSFRKKSYGGLLILKPVDSTLAMTLSSKFGAKVFDFILHKDSLELNYIIEPANKKALKKIIYKDFSMLYPILLDTKKTKHKKNKIILKKRTKKYTYFYDENVVVKINKNRGLNTIEIAYKDQKIESISIKHKFIGLQLTLEPLSTTNE